MIRSVTVAVGIGISNGATVKRVLKDEDESAGCGLESVGDMEANGCEDDVAAKACTVMFLRYACKRRHVRKDPKHKSFIIATDLDSGC